MPRYRIYDLTVESEFELPALSTNGNSVDVTVRFGERRPVPAEPPQGSVLAHLERGPLWYSTVRTPTGYLIRYSETCDAAVNAGLDHVELFCPEQKESLAQAVFVGSVMAQVMTLAGYCVLHASAARVEGRAFAFVGPPGAGKTTVAAMVCSAGGRLMTDDVLRLIPGDDGWRAPAGTAQLRLRAAAASLADALAGPSETTADERTGVTLDLAEEEALAALVFPLPSRAAGVVEGRRLTQEDVLIRLTRFPRVAGWIDPDVLARNFRWTARLAREVPGYEVTIPWGPPFRSEIVMELVHVLRSSFA